MICFSVLPNQGTRTAVGKLVAVVVGIDGGVVGSRFVAETVGESVVSLVGAGDVAGACVVGDIVGAGDVVGAWVVGDLVGARDVVGACVVGDTVG